jgi:nucleoside-diphosphate-sugar epimerase
LTGRPDRYEWVRGDAMQQADVLQAARGVSLIVHAVNPPGYRDWAKLVLPMLDNTIHAARASGARIVLPGTVYNYGPDTWSDISEHSAQHPQTRKGRIRAEMEARLRAASLEGVRSLIVRAGDFFGPRAANNWFSQGLVTPGKPVTRITYPGKRGVGHQWAYLPDVAETMVRLVGQDHRLEPFAVFHMEGHWDADGAQMTRAIQRAVLSGHTRATSPGHAKPALRAFPWWFVLLASPFVTLFREMREMRYLWRVPVRMSNARLVRVLGEEPHTPLDEAVRSTLAGLGCLNLPIGQPGSEVTSLAH